MEVKKMVGDDCHSWCNDRSCCLKSALQTLTLMSSLRASFTAERPAYNGEIVQFDVSV